MIFHSPTCSHDQKDKANEMISHSPRDNLIASAPSTVEPRAVLLPSLRNRWETNLTGGVKSLLFISVANLTVKHIPESKPSLSLPPGSRLFP